MRLFGIITTATLGMLLSGGLFAKDAENLLLLPDLSKLRAMNGINPAPYSNFWEKWTLVTTRYRADNGELRYVYANDLAYNAMKEGKLIFPDGAAFGKVAFKSEEDPQFPNSFEAEKFTRLQLMVKDSKKFAKMNGWSYWLFVQGGADHPGEDSQNAMACHACHTIVKDRDYIFSLPTFLGEKASFYANLNSKTYESQFIDRKTTDLTNLEKKILDLLPEKETDIKSYRMRLFAGSLHESIGPLHLFALKGKTHLLVDPVAKKFIAMQKMKPTKECKDRTMVVMDNRKTSKKKDGVRKQSLFIRKGIVCNGKNKWIKRTPMPKDFLE